MYKKYFDDCIGSQAISHASQMKSGDITLFGNTRLHKEEQLNCTEFAKELARLGDEVVIGGFSKLHRENASNSAMRPYLPWRDFQKVFKD
ncbi:phosphoglycerate kinase [Vibrio sp. PP-XX7]